MRYRELGDSGVEVSEIGFGAWVIGTSWWGDRSEANAREMVDCALDEGITYFDTSDVYGHGRSEELLGEIFDERRDDVVLATKVGYDFYTNPQAGHGELPRNIESDYIRKAVNRSLERLGTDYVDVLQLHNPNVDEITPNVLETLDELREEGKFEAVGIALGPAIGWLAEGDFAIEQEFDAVQFVGNLFEQDVLRHFTNTIERIGSDASLIPRVVHSSGLLNEQVTPDTDFDESDHRGYRPDEWYETGWEKLEAIRFLEREGDRTIAQAAIQWLLTFDDVATVTPTFRSEADILEWTMSSETPRLSETECSQINKLATDNFGVDRFDGMSIEDYRTSVGGDDLRKAGLIVE